MNRRGALRRHPLLIMIDRMDRERTAGERLARIVTEVFAPAVLVAVLLVVAGWHAGERAGVARWWGLPGAVFAAGIPIAYVLRGVRAGRYADHHLADREHRRIPLLVGIASVAVGVTVLIVLGAPREIVALLVAGGVGLLVCVVVSQWWKMSIHAAVAAGAVTVLVTEFGPRALPAAVLVPLIGWARVRLGAHTVAQVLVGALAGALIAGTVFPALR